MEEPQGSVSKDHSMLISSLDALRIHNTSARRSQVLDTALPGTVDVIREGEERVTRARNAVQLGSPLLLGLLAQRLNGSLEQALPVRLLTALQNLAADVEVDGVGLFSSLDSLLERKSKDLWVVAEPPEIGLTTGKTSAVNTRLLACTDADDRAMECVGNTVGLSVFQGEGGDDQVGGGFLRKLTVEGFMSHTYVSYVRRTNLLALGDDVSEQLRVDFGIVAALLKSDTVDLLGLDSWWLVGWIDLWRAFSSRKSRV